MRRLLRLGLAVAVVSPSATPGCQTVGRAIEAPPPPPPLAALVVPPTFLTPHSRRYRLAVREFVDQTGEARGPARSAGEVLSTWLVAGGRFELYDLRPRDRPARHRGERESGARKRGAEASPSVSAGEGSGRTTTACSRASWTESSRAR